MRRLPLASVRWLASSPTLASVRWLASSPTLASVRWLASSPTLALVILGALATPASAQRPRDIPPEVAALYQDYPVVELITMGIGSLIWERHGHIALCVRYADRSQDACYNYGIGDFHNPLGMATGFFRGNKSFWVGKMEPNRMLSIYRNADRTIWVQPLPMTSEQEQKVIAKLEFDILDDNRHYAYDHFWDNCTTRVRDVLDNATDQSLSKAAAKETVPNRTYRDLARDGFYGMRIPLLITDLAMGRPTDRVPTYWERMFLPDYMREATERLWKVKPLVMYERRGPPPLSDGPSGRVILALILLVMTAPAWATKLWGRFERTGLAIAILPYAFFGFVLSFLALISPLPYVRWNETCWLLLPTDILLVWFLSPENRKKYARARVVMIGIFAALMVIGLLEQPIWPALIWPLVPALVVGFWPQRAKAVVAEASRDAKESKRA